MSEDIGNEIAKEFVSQTAGKTYDDVAHPAASATGQLVSFIPRTIKVWLGKWEKWIINGEYSIKETEKLLEKKLANIAEDKITEPEAYVAVPAIQQLSYSLDSEDLREMYANLLASSMNADAKENVHPAFVEIIKQLCPDEAKLLKKISQINNNIPLITVEVMNPEGNFYSKIRNFSDLTFDICEKPLNVCAYIDNLERLKLISIPEDEYLSIDDMYSSLMKHDYIKSIMSKNLPQGHEWSVEKKVFSFDLFWKKICRSLFVVEKACQRVKYGLQNLRFIQI